MTEEPELFSGLSASMRIGNLPLVAHDLAARRAGVTPLNVPCSVLFPALIVIASIDTYSLNRNAYDVLVISGLLAYVLNRCGCEPAPLLLGFVLGPLCGGEPAPGPADLTR